jgi:predicted Fe-Mo cluster-binding NifX family protein
MRIGIPIWQDKVSPVFDTASRLLIVETDEQKEAARREVYFDEKGIAKRCVQVESLGVDTLICGAISRPFSRLLSAAGIRVIQDISGRIEEVLMAYFHGKLLHPKFLMPGCGGRNPSDDGQKPI